VLRGRLPRRSALVGLLMATAAACAAPGAEVAEHRGQASTEPRPSDDLPPVVVPERPSATDVSELPGSLPSAPEPAARYEVGVGEVLPDAKRVAADVAQALTTYEAGVTAWDVAATAAGGDRAEAFLAAIGPLHHDAAWSRGEVVYAQLGGVAGRATSVMVVVDQTVGRADGEVRRERRTIDVRLRFEHDRWRLDTLASAGGTPVPRVEASLSPAARAVLDHPGIGLPDSARWDIHRGIVRDELLTLMLDLAERSRFEAVVLDTGHPRQVFGTDRLSAHTRGLAIDIHELDGRRVVDDRDRDSHTHRVVRWLFAHPDVRRVGSPWALDAFGGRSFTDVVHQDHIHIEVGLRR
jgi:hypothetical protein